MTSSLTRRPEESWLQGEAGRLLLRHWSAAQASVASLVICHGFNAHGGHYDRAAEVFAARGIAVTALDLRGRGCSDGERFYVEAVDDYAADLAQAVAFARTAAPGRPIFLLGHSAGGVVTTIYAANHQAELAGLISESFAYRVFAPDLALALLRGVSHVAPHLSVVRLDCCDFSRDPAWQAVLSADPLIRNEVQPVATMAALARADATLGKLFPTLTLPLLLLHGTADKATRPEGSRAFLDAARSADKTLKLYDGHVHDLLNDLGRDRVMNDIGNWIEARADYINVSMTPPSTRSAAPVVAEASGDAR